MAVPGVRVGEWAGPFAACLDRDLLRAYAQATRDPSPRVQAGEAAAAGAIVTTIWEAQEGGRAAAVPAEFQVPRRLACTASTSSYCIGRSFPASRCASGWRAGEHVRPVATRR